MRTVKDATVHAFRYAAVAELRRHVTDWLAADNFARRLGAPRWRTPMQAIAAVHVRRPEIFLRRPVHLILGLNA